MVLWLSNTPNVLDPVLWTEPFPLPSLGERNDFLSGSTYVKDSRVLAPESFAMSESGEVFASTSYGVVVVMDENGHWKSDLFFVGGFIYPDVKIEDCRTLALAGELAWSKETEKRCGRPLGLRLVESTLWVVCAYHGIFSIDVQTVSVSHQIAPAHIITLLPDSDPLAAKTPFFFNDVEVDGDIVYFTDSSYKNRRAENRQEVIDGAPRGRLLAFNRKTSSLHVLLCGLHFPNGLLKFKESLLMVESARFRVLKVDARQLLEEQQSLGRHHVRNCSEFGDTRTLILAGSQGLVTEFLNKIPGFPDNIRRGKGRQGPLLIGIATKSSKPFSLLWAAYQSVWLRVAIGRLVPMQWIEYLLPKFGMVMVIDPDDRQKLILQAPEGTVSFVSEAQIHPTTGALWLGTHHNPYSVAILTSSYGTQNCAQLSLHREVEICKSLFTEVFTSDLSVFVS